MPPPVVPMRAPTLNADLVVIAQIIRAVMENMSNASAPTPPVAPAMSLASVVINMIKELISYPKCRSVKVINN